jgi:hypothetical protein
MIARVGVLYVLLCAVTPPSCANYRRKESEIILIICYIRVFSLQMVGSASACVRASRTALNGKCSVRLYGTAFGK